MYITQTGAQHSLKAYQYQLPRRNLNHTLGSAESKVGILARASYRARRLTYLGNSSEILLRDIYLGTLKCFKQCLDIFLYATRKVLT